MGDNDQIARLYNSKVGIVTQLAGADYEKMVAASRAAGRIQIVQSGPWPEFLFRDSIITLDLGGRLGRWLVEDVSVAGVTLRRVAGEDLLRP